MHGSSVYKLDFRFQQCSSTNVYTHTISSVIFYFIIIFYIVPFHSMLIPACHLFTAPFLPLILWFSVILSLGVLFTFHTFSLQLHFSCFAVTRSCNVTTLKCLLYAYGRELYFSCRFRREKNGFGSKRKSNSNKKMNSWIMFTQQLCFQTHLNSFSKK